MGATSVDLAPAAESSWYGELGYSLLHEEVAATLALSDEPLTPAQIVEVVGYTTRDLINRSLDPLTEHGIVEREGTRRRLTDEGIELLAEHAEDKLLRVDAAAQALGLDLDADHGIDRANVDPLYMRMVNPQHRYPSALAEETIIALALGRRWLTGSDPSYSISAFTGYDPTATRGSLNTPIRNHLFDTARERQPGLTRGGHSSEILKFKPEGTKRTGLHLIRSHTQLARVVLAAA